MTALPSEYHRRLPYGERVSAEPLLGEPFFPFEGDLQVVRLADPVLPEPPRRGEDGGQPCPKCADPDRSVIWRDDQWSLKAFEPTGLPLVALLEPHEPSGLPMVLHMAPNEHVTLHTMGPEVAGAMGTLIQRVAVAIGEIPGVARTHFSRWGDGSEHFHLWFLARPLGMMQLRGAMIAAWDDMLPKIPADEFTANARQVAAALAEDGGEAVS